MTWWGPRRRRPPRETELDLSSRDKRRLVYEILNAGAFPWRVVLGTGASVFAYSYNVAALDFALPSLQYLYWHHDSHNQFLLHILSLVGLIYGSLFFGHLADRYGRRVAGGLPLVLMIFSVLGFIQSSSGLQNSMSMLVWLCFWRVLLCIGAGALLPVNSVTVAEWAPTRFRTKSLAAVFSMQPLGQLLAAVVSLIVTNSFKKSEDIPSAKTLDQVWRIIVGVGVIPALVAVILRTTMPETPRFTLDVHNKNDRAYKDVQALDKYHDAALGMSVTNMFESGNRYEMYIHDDPRLPPKPFSGGKLLEYFIYQSNWRYLAGIGACWYFLGTALTCLDGSNISTMNVVFHKVMNSTNVDNSPKSSTQALAGLWTYSWQYIVLISAGSVLGVALSIPTQDYIRRRLALMCGFISLAFIFLIGAVVLSQSGLPNLHEGTLVIYILSYFLANYGPSVPLVLLSAEIFPTKYRATAFGMAMSFGSLASLLVTIILHYTSSENGRGTIHRQSITLGVSVALLALAAFFAWIWIPDVQEPKEPGEVKFKQFMNKTLEELADGVKGAEREGQVIGFRSHSNNLKSRLRFPPRSSNE